MKQGDTRRWLFGLLRPYLRQLSVGIAVATCAGAIATIDPLLMRQLIDRALPRKSVWLTSLDVGLIAVCFVGRSVLAGLSSLVSFRVTLRITQDLRTQLLVHMTDLSSDWHDKTLVGQKVSRIEQDVDQISQYGSDVSSTVFRSVVFFCVNLTIMMFLNWRMTAVVIPLLPVFLWVRLRFRRSIQARADDTQAQIGNAAASLTEHLGAVPQIQLIGAENIRVAKTVDGWLEALSAQWAQRRTEIGFSVAVTCVLAAGILFVLAFGAHEYFVGVLSIGGLVAFYAYVTRIFEPVSSAMELYARTQRMLASARRVREVLDLDPTVADTGKIDAPDTPIATGLICERVSFGYLPSRIIVHDISFSVRPGERIALVGKSGSGKSSISRLMARLADPVAGHLSLEGHPLPSYALRALRRAVSYVPQQPVLFSGTIRENLLLAKSNATDSEMQSVIETAQFQHVLNRLPSGIDTVLGTDAVGLSGGERQRLAIARALLRNPQILILDESTSALDLPTEVSLFRALERHRSDLALILISHRLRSLTWVDRIVVLDAGKVVDEGTHVDLYHYSQLYRDLFEREEEAVTPKDERSRAIFVEASSQTSVTG